MRAVSFTPETLVHASEKDLPKEERTEFVIAPLCAEAAEAIENASASVEFRLGQDDQATKYIKALSGTKMFMLVQFGLREVRNLLDETGAQVQLETEHSEVIGRSVYTAGALSRIPEPVRTWLAIEIQKRSNLTEVEKGKS